MNFDFSAQENAFRDTVKATFDSTSGSSGLDSMSGIGGIDDSSDLMLNDLESEDMDGVKELLDGFFHTLAKAGYFTNNLDPAGVKEILGLIYAQQIVAGRSASLFITAEMTARLFGGLVANFGTDAQKKEILPRIQDGQVVASVALADGTDSEGNTTKTKAIKDGDHYTLNGTKSVVANALIADYIAIKADVDGKPAMFILNPGLDGLHFGERLKLVGHEGLVSSIVRLEGAKVSASQMIGPFADERPFILLRQIENLILAVSAIGIAERAYATSKEYAKNHKKDGRAIIDFQTIRFKLAEMLMLIQTSVLLVYRAGWMMSEANHETPTLILAAKSFSSEAAERVASEAMQILASRGYLAGNEVEKAFRESKYASISGTTNELAKIGIADMMLERYRI